MVFVGSIKRSEILMDRLYKDGFTADVIHGKMRSEERSEIVRKLKTGDIRVLISTDLLGRGIDVQQTSTVINYDLPGSRAQYLHRIGRSGRYGRHGTAINFVTSDSRDRRIMKEIESFYGREIKALPSDLNS